MLSAEWQPFVHALSSLSDQLSNGYVPHSAKPLPAPVYDYWQLSAL